MKDLEKTIEKVMAKSKVKSALILFPKEERIQMLKEVLIEIETETKKQMTQEELQELIQKAIAYKK